MDTVKYYVHSICIRNDGEGEKSYNIKKFTSKNDAIKYINDYIVSNSYDDDVFTQEMQELLLGMKVIWIWEWKRKGNGDCYFIATNKNPRLDYAEIIDMEFE